MQKSIPIYIFLIVFFHISVYADTGDMLFSQGRFAEAVRYWEKQPQTPVISMKTAKTYQYSGLHLEALNILTETHPAEDSAAGDKTAFLNTLADACISAGFLNKAADILIINSREANKLGDKCLLADILMKKGNLLAAAHHWKKAAEAYITALKPAEHNRCEPGQKTDLLISLSMLPECDSTFPEKALAAVKKLPVSYIRTADLVSVGIAAIGKNDFATASDAFAEAENFFSSGTADNLALSSYICGYRGQICEKQGSTEKAVRLTRKALLLSGLHPESRYLWEWQMARLYRLQDRTDKAAEFYRQAINTLFPVKKSIYSNYKTAGIFKEEIRPVYLGLADLLLSRGDIAKGRDVMESLKKAELQEYFLDDCIAEKAQTGPVNQTRPGTAVIYPIILPDRLSVILTLPSGMKEISISADSDTVVRTVLLFRKQLQNRADNYSPATAETLHNWLIAPVLDDLARENISTLVIVPDGVLRLVPFAALYDGSSFLVEKYAVSYALGISLPENKPGSREQTAKTLIAGLSEGVQGFSPLPNVEKEITGIKKYTEPKILYNSEYTVPNISDEIRTCEYNSLHIATHGFFGSSSSETFLLTYEDKFDIEYLETLLSACRNKPDMLILSACQTAAGDDRAALGLAGTAVRTGVESTVATLWAVSDKSSAVLLTEFYKNIDLKSKSASLQSAQKKLIAEGLAPFYWAPYLLIERNF